MNSYTEADHEIDQALLWACKRGYENVVKILLNNKCIVLNNAICKAAKYGHASIVSLLLQDDKVNPNIALRAACLNRHVEVVRVLLEDKRLDRESSSFRAIVSIVKTKGFKEIVELLQPNAFGFAWEPGKGDNCFEYDYRAVHNVPGSF